MQIAPEWENSELEAEVSLSTDGDLLVSFHLPRGKQVKRVILWDETESRPIPMPSLQINRP